MKKNHKVYGMILDLRSNSGGLLPQAVDVTGLFIEKGVVASIFIFFLPTNTMLH